MPIRTPDQRLRVFISSTLQELAAERAAARDAVTRLRLTPVLFELGARPHPPQELYRAYIAQSQLFVGIYWQSYGWVGPGMDISGLEDEYLLSTGLPRLIYVKDPAPDRVEALAALLQRIRDEGSLSYKHFRSADELGELVADDLALLLSEGFSYGRQVLPTALPSGSPSAGHDGRIRVMIVDDHATVRSGLAAFLSAYDDFELVGQAADGAEAVRLCPEVRPDVVLMDMVMPVMDGAAATEAARALCPDLRVIALTSFKQDELVERALAAGAIGYLLKNVSGDDLAQAIRSAHAGRSTLSPEAAQVMIRRADRGPAERVRTPLPVPPTPLVGRDTELAYLEHRLLDDDVRLVTLTGVGGCGKTRLALELARRLADRFADGASFVSLATVRDPSLVPAAVCAALTIPDVAGWTHSETLSAFLAGKQLLLILDNLEQVVESASFVTDLLQAAPRITALVTSRTSLRVRGEHEYVVPPLPIPGPEVPVALANAGHFAALQLFVERARDVLPGFALTEQNVTTVAEICRRLDGLPLALELAAARSRLLPPAGLLARLERPLDALGEGLRDLPERQRSLRTTLAWSHELLDETARTLFRRLAVFSGGWTLDAAEAVCGPAPDGTASRIDVLGGIETLLEASLVERHETDRSDIRFSMLETVNEYATERMALDGADEEPVLRRRHAAWFLDLAEQTDRGLRGPRRTEWRSRLDEDFGNVRAAVTWSCSPDSDPDLGAGIAYGLTWYWEGSSHTDEAVRWVDDLRECGPSRPTAVARLEVVAGCLGWLRNELDRGRTALEQARALLADEGPSQTHVYALALLAMITLADGRPAEAVTLLEAAAPLADQTGDPWCRAFVSYWRGDALTAAGRESEAWDHNQEGLRLFRTTGDPWGIAIALFSISWLYYRADDLVAARTAMEESVQLLRATNDRWGLSWALAGGAFLVLQSGEIDRARGLFTEALTLGRDHGNPAGVVVALAGVAATTAAENAQADGDTSGGDASRPARAREALRLLGAAEQHRSRAAVMPWAFANVVMPRLEADVENAAAALLDAASCAAERSAGRGLDVSHAVAMVT